MAVDARRDPTFPDLVAQFPRGSIRDEGTYHAAIAILDRLFALAPERTPAERATFRALARRAARYERGLLRDVMPRTVSGLLGNGPES